MKKLEIQDADIMRVAVQQEIVRSQDARYDNKLHGILLACSGMTCEEIADILGRSIRTIHYWFVDLVQMASLVCAKKMGGGVQTVLPKTTLTELILI